LIDRVLLLQAIDHNYPLLFARRLFLAMKQVKGRSLLPHTSRTALKNQPEIYNPHLVRFRFLATPGIISACYFWLYWVLHLTKLE